MPESEIIDWIYDNREIIFANLHSYAWVITQCTTRFSLSFDDIANPVTGTIKPKTSENISTQNM